MKNSGTGLPLEDITDKCLFKVIDSNQKEEAPLPATSKTSPLKNPTNNYYHEYCRLYLANVVLTNQAKQLVLEKNEILSKIAKLQKKDEENDESDYFDRASKRHRRTANEIYRNFRCSVETCQKSYGSEGSLNQHIKNKHPEIYATMPHVDENSRDDRTSLIGMDQPTETTTFEAPQINKLVRRRTLFF